MKIFANYVHFNGLNYLLSYTMLALYAQNPTLNKPYS